MVQDYGKYGIVDMTDKQKLFRLTKRLNSEPGGQASAPGAAPRPLRAGKAAQNPAVSSLEARLRAQMLDGNAALLSLADEADEGPLMQVLLLWIPIILYGRPTMCSSHSVIGIPKFEMTHINQGANWRIIPLCQATAANCWRRQVDDLDGYAAASPAQQQPELPPLVSMPEEVHLPKIRVVVRKRPLNHRVSDPTALL